MAGPHFSSMIDERVLSVKLSGCAISRQYDGGIAVELLG
jgi:hypothetical protein